MIVPMKKVTILIPESQRNNALLRLGELGVLHITPVVTPLSEHELKSVMARLALLKTAIHIIKNEPIATSQFSKGKDGFEIARRIVELADIRKHEEERNQILRQEAIRAQPIGDFDDKALKCLNNRGLKFSCYVCSPQELTSISNNLPVSVIGRDRDNVYIAVVSKGETADLPLQPFPLPEQSYSEITKRADRIEQRLKEIQDELETLAVHRDTLNTLIADTECQLKMKRVHLGMGTKPPVCYAQGYCPATRLDDLRKAAGEFRWGLRIENPWEKDSPPTLISNPQWVRIISPVFKMIDTLPGYREYDVSLWYLLYLGIFFALLIGDAGYGLIFLTSTYFLQLKFQSNYREPFRLAYVFSILTILWGAVTGNWFGIQKLSEMPILHSLILPSINAFSSDSQSTVMLLCFLIGASHISIAHLIAAMNGGKSLKMLAQFGWVLMIWGAFFVVRLLALEMPLPRFAYGLITIGAMLTILFTEPQRNLLKALGIGLARFPMKAMNCFSDVISYIRLFAVGMATLAVAASFNDLAANFGFGTVQAVVISSVILFLGHGINILMALLSVIVHGVRLNMLEFSGHLDMQWTGEEYTPFQISKSERDSVR